LMVKKAEKSAIFGKKRQSPTGSCEAPSLKANTPGASQKRHYIQRPRAFFAFADRLAREAFVAPFGPRTPRAGRLLMAARLNFRAARRAPSFPPYPLSLNNLVTVSRPRRKWT
jgi:hypothetical protein